MCGNLRQIEEMHKQDTLWVCTYDAGERVRTQLDRGNARQRPFTIRPVPHPKPWDNYYPNLLETDDAAVFNFLAQQVAAQCRFERVESGHAAYTSAGGSLPALSWAARYFFDLIQENARPLLVPKAKELLGTIATFLLTRQAGSLTGFSPSSTRATDAFFGGFLASGATTYVTDDTATSGLALLYAYRALETRAYLDGAKAAANYLRNVQAIGSNATQHTSTDAAGVGRLYTGAVCSEVLATVNFYSNHLFYPHGLLALEFWNELKATNGDQSIGATVAVAGFDSTPSQLLSRSITDMRTCWETGITDSTGTLVNGFSSTTPREYFNAYPQAKSGFSVLGTGLWEYVDGNAAVGTQISGQNFGQAISSLYNYEGATSQVTTISDWLRTFTSNPDFETPDNTSTPVLYRTTTGTYDPVDSLSTVLQVRDPTTLESTAINASSLFDWGVFGLMSRVWASRNTASFRASRLFPLNIVQRFFDGNPNDGLTSDRIILRGLSGLSMQTGFTSDILSPSSTQAYPAGSQGSGSTQPPRLGLVQWIKGDAGLTVVATKVSAWADQSGFGQNFLQANPGNQPYSLATINGIPSISFGVAGDANKFMQTAAQFKDRNGVAMSGTSARTVMVVWRPRYDPAYGRTGGYIWGQGDTTHWNAYFELRSDVVANGAYAWTKTIGDYGNALQFTPIPGGAGGPFDGIATITEWTSSGWPDITFRINNAVTALTPATMNSTPGTPDVASLSTQFIACLGAISEVLVWDYAIDADARSQAIQYLTGRYASTPTTAVSLAMTNDAVRAAQYGRAFRESRS